LTSNFYYNNLKKSRPQETETTSNILKIKNKKDRRGSVPEVLKKIGCKPQTEISPTDLHAVPAGCLTPPVPAGSVSLNGARARGMSLP